VYVHAPADIAIASANAPAMPERKNRYISCLDLLTRSIHIAVIPSTTVSIYDSFHKRETDNRATIANMAVSICFKYFP
jgi:hypothetical protein